MKHYTSSRVLWVLVVCVFISGCQNHRDKFDYSIISGVDTMFPVYALGEPKERMYFGLSELDNRPRILEGDDPLYPFQMRRREEPGFVELNVFVSPDGRVEKVKVVSFTHIDFIQPSVDSAFTVVFSPGIKDGEKVWFEAILPMTFTPR